MREYVFLLEYERGIHPIRDVFINHPDVVATALDISITLNGGWRIEHLSGEKAALDAVQAVYFNEQCNDCTYPTSKCDTALEYQVLEREPTSRTIYRHVTEMSYCTSLGYLALETLGNGLVFDTTQRGPYYEWRVLVPIEQNVDAFHQTLREKLPDGVSLTVRRIGGPERWLHDRRPRFRRGVDLPYEQREAVETAWQMGYYAHPRDATMEDIAAELGLAVTTLRYRLRRAEAWATATALDVQFGASSPVTRKRDESVAPSTVPTDDKQ